MIIDAHVHFPFSLDLPETEWGAWMVRQAARCGIDALIVSDVFIRGSADAGAFPASAALRRANGYAADQAKRNPGKLYFLAYLNPQNPDWEEELERSLAEGAIGIKLWISLKDAKGGLDNTIKVLRKAVGKDLPVVIHTFNRADANSEGEIHISEFAELSQAVPECRLIGAHSGANFRESCGVFSRVSPNTCWDVSGTNPDCALLTYLLREVPAEKVLFGSDGPGRSFVSQLHKVTLAPIPDEAKKMILGPNAVRVFRLPGPFGHEEQPAPGLPAGLPDPREEHYIFCGRWPFFEGPGVTPRELESMLSAQNIEKAFTASFDSIFRLDLLNANREFRRACAGLSRVRPLAVTDPEAKNITDLLSDAAENGDAGVWYSPALLGQDPGSPAAIDFYAKCKERKLRVYLNGRLGDERFRHRALHLRNLGAGNFAGFFKNAPRHDYVIQGVPPLPQEMREDCAFTFERLTDSERGLVSFLSSKPGTKILWGSEFPFREIDQVRLAAAGKPFRGEDVTK